MSDLWYWNKAQIEWLWGQFQNFGLSDNGIAGIMGNLYQESGVCPYKCEGWNLTTSKNYSYNTIRNYINPSDFINEYYGSGTGYSLAQWSYSRKGDFWNWNSHSDWNLIGTDYQMYRDGALLIHDLSTWAYEQSIEPDLWDEMGRTVWQWLTDPNVTVEDAVDAMLMCYEKPFIHVPPTQADYDYEHDLRVGFAYKMREDFAGIAPPPTPPIPPTPPTPGGMLPFWVLFKLKDRYYNDNKRGEKYYEE